MIGQRGDCGAAPERRGGWIAAVAVSLMVATSGAADAQALRDPPLVAGDILKVDFLELPELSDERVVAADGTMSFPSGERIVVAGFDLIAAEERVRLGLADGPLRNPTVSLTIVERVPVAVLGDVRAPGEYPYKAGMRVLRAVAAAGGYGSQASLPGSNSRELANDYANSASLLARINALKARLARLDAELAGRVFVAPADDTSGGFAVAEQELAALRRSEHEAERTVLLTQLEPIDERITLIAAQIESQKGSIALFAERVQKQEDLFNRGLTTQGSLLDLQLTRSRMESDLLNLQAELAFAQQNRSRIQKEIDRVGAALRRQISEERREVMEELAVLYERFRFASLSVGSVAVSPSGGIQFGAAPTISHILTVVREGPEGAVEFAAGEETPLLPGDIVRVRSVLLDGSVGSSFTEERATQ